LKIKFGDIVSGIEEDSEDLVESKKKSKVDKKTFDTLIAEVFRITM
jgi:hypothetical protein